jgi:hypothetical protein
MSKNFILFQRSAEISIEKQNTDINNIRNDYRFEIVQIKKEHEKLITLIQDNFTKTIQA